ncbi:MAG: flagellar hook-basal body complex protein FliE [Bdellovibrionales bacterium]|nr:flagellar hook-basal body complex protein FliE [Bdellovibrionales bacterium]
MSINSIQGMQSALSNGIDSALSVNQDKGDQGFSAYLKNSFDQVNKELNTSDKLASDLAVGKNENLHETMIGMEKAESAFKLLIQVRNRALEAYHEIMRMQI